MQDKREVSFQYYMQIVILNPILYKTYKTL